MELLPLKGIFISQPRPILVILAEFLLRIYFIPFRNNYNLYALKYNFRAQFSNTDYYPFLYFQNLPSQRRGLRFQRHH